MKLEPLLLLCLFSCFLPNCNNKSIPKQSGTQDTFCENYYAFISNNFHADSLGVYRLDDLFPLKRHEQTATYRNEILNKCIIGKKKEEIISVFGKPSFSTKNRMDYYFNNNCSGINKNPQSPSIANCVRLKIYFDDNGIITGVPAIMLESGQTQ